MITWWAWTISIILVFHVSNFGSLESLLDLFHHTANPLPQVRTTLVIIFILFFNFSILVKLSLNSHGYCDQDPLIPVFPIHKFSECMTGILSLVMGDDIIHDSSLLDIIPFIIHELPEFFLCDTFHMPC